MPQQSRLEAVPPPSRYTVAKHRKSRFWSVSEGDTLIAVCVYKKGAEEVVRRLVLGDYYQTLYENTCLVADMIADR